MSGSGGGGGSSGGESPKLYIDRVQAGGGLAVNVTWGAAFTGCTLEVNPRPCDPPGWQAVPQLPVPFPEDRQGVTITIGDTMPHCFFRLKCSGLTPCSLGVREFPVNANPDGFLSWRTCT